MAICQLCLREKQLIKKSHIIPDFIYENLYNSEHKLIRFNPFDLSNGNKNKTYLPTGEYEGGLLCADCDNRILGGYENYASKVLKGGLSGSNFPQIKQYRTTEGTEFTEIKNIDYCKFKLFLLSILWRGHISTRPMFNEINIGTNAEIIRKMIFEGNPGDSLDYPILTLTFANDKTIPLDMIGHPQERRTQDGHLIYTFIIYGLIYVYFIDGRVDNLPEYVKFSMIKPINEMNIIHIPPGEAWDLMKRYYGL